MIEYKPTPSEIKARARASREKPKKVQAKCEKCAGTGEVSEPGHHAVRCPACLGSGLAIQSGNRQIDAFVFGN